MSYIRHTLGRNETLLYRGHFHWLYRAAAWGALLVSLAAGIATYTDEFPWVALAAYLVGVVLFVTIMIPIWTTEIGVTNQRLIFKQGLIRRATDELQLRAIEEINLKQSVVGRLLNFGRVEVHGTGVDDVLLPTLENPLALRRALQEAIGATAPPSGLPQAASSQQR